MIRETNQKSLDQFETSIHHSEECKKMKDNEKHTARLKGKGAPCLEPLGDRILVELFDSVTTRETEGGILLPETVSDETLNAQKKKPMEGIIIALGKGKKLEDGSRSTFDVEIGDTVIFGKYAGNSHIYTDGDGIERTYLLVQEFDLLARIA